MSDRLALANAIEDAGIERSKAQRLVSVILGGGFGFHPGFGGGFRQDFGFHPGFGSRYAAYNESVA